MRAMERPVSKDEYVALAEFRHGLRQFLRFSEGAARNHGLTPQQHQLLLAIKGFPGRDWATVNELAERLQLQQHSVVGIISRSEQAGFVVRLSHEEDLRVTEVHLTKEGDLVLESLTLAHREELQRTGEFLATVSRMLGTKPQIEDSTADEREGQPPC